MTQQKMSMILHIVHIFQKDYKKEYTNLINKEGLSDKNFAQKEYWLEEKNSYIQELEKKSKRKIILLTDY